LGGRASKSQRKRLLVVYDLSSQPVSIGDILVIQEASLILKEQLGSSAIDLAIVCDPEFPAPPDPAQSHIGREHARFHLASILSAAQINDSLGSLLLFDSHRLLSKYVLDNGDEYVVWPGATDMLRGRYLYYDVFNRLIHDFFVEHGRIPRLNCSPFFQRKADDFIFGNAAGRVPVTVNIRNNPVYGSNRNADMDAWISFFHQCNERFPAHFIILCAAAEVDSRLRNLPNVTIAKDKHSTIELDLALIQQAACHMGCSSGPVTVAVFNPKPYFIVKGDFTERQYKGSVRVGDFIRLAFATEHQSFLLGPETAEILMREFEQLWEACEKDRWLSGCQPADASESRSHSWLR
jgi:ribosomal protein S28E/S33